MRPAAEVGDLDEQIASMLVKTHLDPGAGRVLGGVTGSPGGGSPQAQQNAVLVDLKSVAAQGGQHRDQGEHR